MTILTLSSNGRITIPKAVRDSLKLRAGDTVEIVLTSQNELILRPVAKKVDDVFGILEKYKKRKSVPIEKLSFGRSEND